MRREKILKLMGFLGMAVFLAIPMHVFAEEEEAIVYPNCCYDDGTASPVTSDGTNIFANGTSLIFKDGKMYEDVEPYGVFDANDKHIFTAPKMEEIGEDGMHEIELDMSYINTGGTDDTEYGDTYLTLENTTCRRIYVDHVKNVFVNITDSSVLMHYIKNATGNVDYTISRSKGNTGEIYMMDPGAGEDAGLIRGNLNLMLNQVKSGTAKTDILASGTVFGDTKIMVNDSVLASIDAAHITGNDTQKGNVYVEVNDSAIEHISGISNGYSGTPAKINGNIEIKVNNCKFEVGIGNLSSSIRYFSGRYIENIVTGKGTVTIEDSAMPYVYDSSNKTGQGVIGKNTEVTVKNSQIKNVVSEVVNLYGSLAADVVEVETREFYAKENAVLTGSLSVSDKVSGTFIWQPYNRMRMGKNAAIEKGTMIYIVPVKKTDTGFIPYQKTEVLQDPINVEFEERTDAADFLKYFTCDYSDMRSVVEKTYDGKDQSRIRVLSYCKNHRWKNALSYGDTEASDYAKTHDVAATCTQTGLETYYCTLCHRYETRTVKVLGHRYSVHKVIAPTKSDKGYTVYKCLRCGSSYNGNYTNKLPDNTSGKKSISKLKFSMVSSCAYTGKTLKPSVTVKNGNKKLKNNTDYKISYKNNKNIGTATVTITGKGTYTGTKKLTFKILPKKNTIISIKSSQKKAIALKWKKDSKVTGYIIQYSTDKNFKKGVKKITMNKNKHTSTNIENLKSKKNYYVRVTSYKKVNGKTYIGKYSAAKRIKVK